VRKAGRAINYVLRPFGVRLVQIPVNEPISITDGCPPRQDADVFGTVVHCLICEDIDLVELIRQRHKTATQKIVEELERLYFSGDGYLSFRRSLGQFEAVLARAALPRNFRLLDVGCAVGQLVPFLQEVGFSGLYFGIDIVNVYVASAQRRFGNPSEQYHFLEGDALKIPFHDGSFDFVYSRSTLVSTYDWKRGLQEHLRVAKKWLLLLQVPFHRGERETIFIMQHSRIHASLLCSFTREALLSQLPINARIEIRPCGSGFEVVNFGTVEWHDVLVELR